MINITPNQKEDLFSELIITNKVEFNYSKMELDSEDLYVKIGHYTQIFPDCKYLKDAFDEMYQLSFLLPQIAQKTLNYLLSNKDNKLTTVNNSYRILPVSKYKYYLYEKDAYKIECDHYSLTCKLIEIIATQFKSLKLTKEIADYLLFVMGKEGFEYIRKQLA